MKVKVVTGFVPLGDRNHRNYHDHGARLLQVTKDRIFSYTMTFEQTWLWQFLLQYGIQKVTHSVSDNPTKNTLAYLCVQHQKTEWLLLAAMEDTDSDVFVWMDYGIFHIPGVSESNILDFLNRVDDRGLCLPGCWSRGTSLSDAHPNWRFCGGLIVAPRRYVFDLDQATKKEAKRHIRDTHNVSWEVNTWARAEFLGTLKATWYKADHDVTMFSNYGKAECLEYA